MALAKLRALGTAINEVVAPTLALYGPLLIKNGDAIRSVKRETYSYGPHERQKLDLYLAPKPAIRNGRTPVLLFEYGGGLVSGDRTLSDFAEGLVNANVAAFFALKFGYAVVIADYRLMSHGAKFPSGGEDIALAVEWIRTNATAVGSANVDLFIMGHSAGGIHAMTFLLAPDFAAQRRKILEGQGVRLRGVVSLATPLSFASPQGPRGEILKTYFGDIETRAPLGLLKAARERDQPLDFARAGARVILLTAELDMLHGVLTPRDAFVKEWLQLKDDESRYALGVDHLLGHNHISPVVALSTGIEDEEAWGHQVAAFCDGIRKFAPKSSGA